MDVTENDRHLRAGQDVRTRPCPRRARPDGRRRARCMASSGPTARASRRRSGCCWGCCATTRARPVFGLDPWRDAADIHRRLAYVPGRREPVAQPVGRRDHRPVAADAWRRPARHPPRRAAGALRARPDQEGPRLLQGQPAEGRPGRGVRRARRPAGARRADVGPRPADGAGLQRVPRGAQGRGHDGAAVEPHPQRGRAAGRPGDDHPGGPGGGDRHAGRAAPPASQPGARRGVGRRARPVGAARRPRRRRSRGRSSPARSIPTGCRCCSRRSTTPASRR